jgi:hypothetical protein
VGEALDATLGVEERLARLADLVVPTLGDFCTIEILEASGGAPLVAGEPLREGAPHADRLIAVPLRARGRDLGTLTLRMGPSGRSHDAADRALALQLGRRAGLAVDIGDVCGKGVEAAAPTSLARHSIRPLVRDHPPPSALLGPFAEVRAHDAAAGLPPGDALVLHTDEITEARSGLEMFGEDRLRGLLAGLAP